MPEETFQRRSSRGICIDDSCLVHQCGIVHTIGQ
jgi:hypothetical protein